MLIHIITQKQGLVIRKEGNCPKLPHDIPIFGIDWSEPIGFKSFHGGTINLEQPCLKTVLNQNTKREKPQKSCQDWQGHLSACAPLANPYVPFQHENPERYEATKGLIRGTLFPGLDLPYLGMVNDVEKGNEGLAELQALSFALTELGLYLDTHQDDLEAGELFKAYSELYQQGVAAYQKVRGPKYQLFAAPEGKYLWTKGPWPWEYSANKEG